MSSRVALGPPRLVRPATGTKGPMKDILRALVGSGTATAISLAAVFADGAEHKGGFTKLSSPNCVVHIRAKWGNNDGCVGTGVVVDRNTVLTAAHVVNRGAQLEIVFGGRDGFPLASDERRFNEFNIRYAQHGRDAAKITNVRVPSWVIPAKVAKSDPETGSLVTAYGLYDTDALRIRQARIVGGPGGRRDSNLLFVGVTSEPGDSGSPIFNQDGEVVALLEGSAGWRDERYEQNIQESEWGTRIEIRQWSEPRKATIGARLIGANFADY